MGGKTIGEWEAIDILETFLNTEYDGMFHDGSLDLIKEAEEYMMNDKVWCEEPRKISTGPLADALNWAGISEDEFNKKLAACNSEQERASLITSTLNGEYAAAAEEYNELTAGAQAAREATNNMEQAQARLGEIMEPVTTAWTNFKAGALQWMIDNWNVVATALAGITTALVLLNAETIKQTIATWAQNAAWLASPITWVVLGITALVAGFMLLWNNCEGFRNFWIGLWDNIKAVLAPVIEWIKQAFAQAWEGIKAVWDFVKPYFTMVWENIKAVFSVVKAWFSGMFETAWVAIQAVWDNVTGYFTAIWDTIKGIFAVVKAVLSGNWQEAWDAIMGIVDTWKQYFAGVWENIKKVFGAVGSWFGDTFKAAIDAIKNVWGNIKQFFTETWEKIKSAFNIGDMLSIGKNLLEGLWNGINDKVAWLKGKVKGVVDKIKGWFTGKDGFDEHSPSKWSRQVAVDVNRGTAIGFEKSTDIPVKAAQATTDRIKPAVSLEQARMSQGVGVRDTGFTEVAQAVGMQTAGINSLASEYRRGSNAQVTVPLVLDGRELGRAIIDLGNTETVRTGTSLVIA
jgi:phage-related protein